MRLSVTCLVVLCLAAASTAAAQSAAQSAVVQAEGLKVFVDCGDGCDFDFLRQEITYVNYVRDRRDADVHVLVTTQNTSSGGREYAIQYIGHGRFADHGHRSSYTSSGSDTSDERRRGFTRVLTLGLTPYLMETPTAERLRLQFTPASKMTAPTSATAKGDKWNLWIFRLGASTDLRGERSDTSRQFKGNISASRTTDRWKLSVTGDGQYNKNVFTLSDSSKLSSVSHNYNLRALAVKSLDRNHWAAVARVSTGDSTQQNYARNSRIATGLEYSVFPYDESTRRQMLVQWTVGLNRYEYIEITIYDRLTETRPDTAIQGVFAFRQPWGFSSFSAEYISFLHDLTKRRVELDGRLDVRLFRGLSINTNGKLSLVHDQLYLRAGTASDEQILLRRQRLATGYRYEFSVGFSYQFGSIFNNVVNPRWDR